MRTALIHILQTSKGDMAGYYGSGLSNFMSLMRKTIAQEILNRGDQCGMG